MHGLCQLYLFCGLCCPFYLRTEFMLIQAFVIGNRIATTRFSHCAKMVPMKSHNYFLRPLVDNRVVRWNIQGVLWPPSYKNPHPCTKHQSFKTWYRGWCNVRIRITSPGMCKKKPTTAKKNFVHRNCLPIWVLLQSLWEERWQKSRSFVIRAVEHAVAKDANALLARKQKHIVIRGSPCSSEVRCCSSCNREFGTTSNY